MDQFVNLTNKAINPLLPRRRQFLRFYMHPYWKHAVIASCCSILLGFLSTIIVTMIGPAMQVLINYKETNSISVSQLLGQKIGDFLLFLWPHLNAISFEFLLVWLPIGIIGIAAFKAILQFFVWYLWEWLAEGIAAHLRNDLVYHYIYLNPYQRNQFAEDELSATVTTDCKLMREYLVHFYGGLPREAMQIVFMLITQYLLSPKLCLLFFAGVIPITFLMTRLGKKIKKRAAKALANYSTLTEWLQQRLLGIETIKHYRMEDKECLAMTYKAQELYNRLLKAARLKARTAPFVQFFALATMVGVLIIALQDIASGQLSGSVALSFFSSLALLAQSTAICGRYYNANREGAAAIERIIKTLSMLKTHQTIDISPQIISSEKISEKSNNKILKFRNVDIFYPKAIEPALKKLNFSIEEKEVYCVIGPSGAGKSTLAKVMCGLLPVSTGQILNTSRKSVLKLGYMPQDVQLFPGSIAEQVAYPNTQFERTDIERALDSAGIGLFVKNELPQGIDTIVGMGGRQLSGGQCQRILLARLFYHRFDLIIIDEGTSALDPQTELQFYQAIAKLQEHATILLIAHRPAALSIATRIIQLKDGQIHSAEPK